MIQCIFRIDNYTRKIKIDCLEFKNTHSFRRWKHKLTISKKSELPWRPIFLVI